MELVEVIQQAREAIVAAMEAATLYLTIVSGYLAVAYVAANNLSKFQLATITALFLTFASFFAYGTYQFFMQAHTISVQWGSELYAGQNQVYAYWIGSAQFIGIIAALIFMYDAKKK